MNYFKQPIIYLMLMLMFTFRVNISVADEGMWLLMYLNRNYEDMKELGLKLSPEDIYSVNNASLKDAVVSLQFCTAEIVSPEGLMFTNHHCAYDAIQYHSSKENNYLKDGFWAKTKADELPVEGLTASILIRMEDVTERILQEAEGLDEAARKVAIQQEIRKIVAEATEDTYYNAQVKPMLEGNQYILFVHETFNDVRLVGAPPSSIGNYGGDADNWEWPRHTGDFAMLRIYTAPDGTPATYSEENIPYKPRHFLPISLKGYEPGDFAMVMGFPGGTQRYLTSYGIEMMQKISNPTRIKLREKLLETWKEDMDKDETIEIQYASKYATTANYYKYFIGMNEGLDRLGTIELKREQEREFEKWVNADPDRKEEYGDVLSELEKSYTAMGPYELYYQYLVEGALNVEILSRALAFRGLEVLLEAEEQDKEKITEMAQDLKESSKVFFKDYNATTDKRVMAALLQLYYEGLPAEQRPPVVNDLYKKYKGNWSKMANKVFKKSFIADSSKTKEFLDDPGLKKLQKDPAFALSTDILQHYFENVQQPYRNYRSAVNENMTLYLKGLMEMNADKFYYPDANSTMRLSYGTVKRYSPKDAVIYDYYTTLEGLMAKEDPNDPEFIVPEKLKELYKQKNYGRYGSNGELRVNFITNNDITGGNSGSPVIDGEGNLIGIAFDGNWEAMTGDIDYDDELKRTINADIRYVLFIIDKFAGADRLIKEMTIKN